MTLQRYIARVFAFHIASVMLGLLAVLLTLDVIGESNRILAGAGATDADLWRYGQLRLPMLVTQFLPFAVLLAALITFAALAASSQVVIMRAMGLSPHQILKPMLAVALCCAALYSLWNETVTVNAAARLAAWQSADYGVNPAPSDEIVADTWVEAGDTIIRARAHPTAGGGAALTDVAIFSRGDNGELTGLLLAARGELSAQGIGLLADVRQAALPTRGFDRLEVMPWTPGITAAHFFDQAVNPDHTALPALIAAVRAAGGPEPGVLRAALYHKLARPLAVILMPLLAAVVAFGLARAGNVLARAALGLGLGFSYFIADSLIMAMGRSGALPPSLAAAVPVLLFFIISEAVLFRAEQ